MQANFDKAEKRTTVPFRYDIVGSFLRPAALKEARSKFEAGEITAAELRKVEDEEITKLVQKQKEIGLKGVTDGEFRRSWWHLDFMWGLDGVEKKTIRDGYVFKGMTTRGETATLSGKISCKTHPWVEDFKFLKKVAGDDVVPRQNIPAPSQFLSELSREHNVPITEQIYPNSDELLEDIANAYRNAILSFYEAGCRNIQIDDGTWGMLCDADYRQNRFKLGDDIRSFSRARLDLNNRAVRDLPEDLIITMHTCRGNFRSAWIATGGYETVAEEFFGSADVKAFYLEFDSDRAGGFEPLKLIKDKQVVLGLVTTKTGKLENKEDIKARIAEAAKIIDINRICLSPQCGFASTEEGNTLTEEEQWNKLRLVKEIADEIWH